MDDITHTACLHLLATVQSLQHMEEFEKKNFEGDSAIANTVIEYSMEFQAADSNMEAWETKLSDLKTALDGKYAKKGDYLTSSSLSGYVKSADFKKVENKQSTFVTHNAMNNALKDYQKKA